MISAWTLQQKCRSTAKFSTWGGGLDLRGTVGHRHEESDTEPQSLQQDDNQPLWPVNNHILDGAPPSTLEHNRETLRCVFKSKAARLRWHSLVYISSFHHTSLPEWTTRAVWLGSSKITGFLFKECNSRSLVLRMWMCLLSLYWTSLCNYCGMFSPLNTRNLNVELSFYSQLPCLHLCLTLS